MTKAKPEVQVLTLIVGVKAIKAETARVNTVGASYQQDTHVLACSVLKHVTQHRNITVLTDFIAAMPDMVRKNSLQVWFETFGGFTYKDKEWRFDAAKKTRLGEAMTKPFWKFKALEGAPYIPLEFDSWADTQIKKLEKDAEKTGRDYKSLIMALKTHKVDAAAKTGVN